jgi:DNA-binding NtrC family response regulator
MQLLTAKEVADRCKMPVEWVETAISSGIMPAPICLDGHKRWREKDIDKWMEAGCPPVRVCPKPEADAVISEGGLNLSELEKKAIEEALRVSNGNREEAARLLGVGERTVYRKIREYGLG